MIDDSHQESLLYFFEKNNSYGEYIFDWEWVDGYQNSSFTSSHFLFLAPDELSVFEQMGYLIRESIQYHFFNQEYDDL